MILSKKYHYIYEKCIISCVATVQTCMDEYHPMKSA